MKFNRSLTLVASSVLCSSLLFGTSVLADEVQNPSGASQEVAAVEVPALAQTQASSPSPAQTQASSPSPAVATSQANQAQRQQEETPQPITDLSVPTSELYQEDRSATEVAVAKAANSAGTQAAQAPLKASQLTPNSRSVNIGVVPNPTSQKTTDHGYFLGTDGYWYYRQPNGQVATGTQVIKNKMVFFKEDGRLARGEFVKAEDGKEYYYDVADGSRVTNRFVQLFNDAYHNGKYFSTEFWYYVDNKGQKLTGEQVIDGKQLYFGADGRQVKGTFAKSANGKEYYYDAQDGHRVVNAFVQDHTYDLSKSYRYGRQLVTNNWYYVGQDGQKVKGQQVIKGKVLLFNQTTGLQVKNAIVKFGSGNYYYFDPNTGERVRNRLIKINGVTYQADKDGKLTVRSSIK